MNPGNQFFAIPLLKRPRSSRYLQVKSDHTSIDVLGVASVKHTRLHVGVTALEHPFSKWDACRVVSCSALHRLSRTDRFLRELMMKTLPGNKTYRTPVDLMGHTGYATDEGALIPWPVMRHFLVGIQETRDRLHALNEEMKRWHNQIPDGKDRVESIRRMHEDAAQPIEQVADLNEAVERARARTRRERVLIQKRR